MLVYIENPIDSTKKLLDLISELGKVVGCKVNIQKSIALLYTNNGLSERETIKKPIYYSNNNKKVPRNKFNQGGKRPVLRNLEDTEKRNLGMYK